VRQYKHLIGKPVEVSWQDPETTAGWANDRTVKSKLPIIHSYGILVKVTKSRVVVAGTVSRKCKMWCDIFKFPRGCVMDIKEVSSDYRSGKRPS
jgi:hypothetical protein